jgi:hypothetical protein
MSLFCPPDPPGNEILSCRLGPSFRQIDEIGKMFDAVACDREVAWVCTVRATISDFPIGNKDWYIKNKLPLHPLHSK